MFASFMFAVCVWLLLVFAVTFLTDYVHVTKHMGYPLGF